MVGASLVLAAARFAANAHKGQFRNAAKGGVADPYIRHPGRVAARVSTLTIEEHGIDADDEMIAAAWLHDVLEDCPSVTFEELLKRFGGEVAHVVHDLTNQFTKKSTPNLTRERRKACEVKRLSDLPQRARAIKILDRIDNLGDTDPTTTFASLYAHESMALTDLARDMPALRKELEEAISSLRAKIAVAK